jgi:hypothetical protein
MACNTRLDEIAKIAPAVLSRAVSNSPYGVMGSGNSRRVRRMIAGLSGRAYAYNEGLWAVYFC